MSEKTIKMTDGNITKQIIAFALPLLGSSLVQQLYNTVDLLYVGNAIGKDAAAAVGASTMMITCLVGLFGGLSVGASVVTAKYFGLGNKKSVKDTIHTAMALSLIAGILIMVIGYVFSPTFIHLLGTPSEIVPKSISYLRIYFLSVIFVIIYNMSAGIMRALGNAKSTLMVQFVGGLVNVLMDALFVLKFKLGVDGVAFATLFSQGVSAVLMVMYLLKLPEDLKLKFSKIHINLEIVKRILKIGVPAGCQTLVIALSNVFAQYNINFLGTDSIAALTVYFKVELPIYLPIVAIGSAVTTFVGQNIGAGKLERAKKGTRDCLVLGIILTIITSTLLNVFGEFVFSLFNDDAGVIAEGMRVVSITFPFYFLYVILQVFGDSIRGAGQSTVPMIIIMMNICILRVFLLFIFMSHNQDITSIAVSYPVSWLMAALCMAIYYYRGKWQKKSKAV